MKKKVAIVVLAVLLMGLIVLPGCVAKAELDECKALVTEQAAQINELEAQIVALNSTIEAKDAEIAEREEKMAELETEIERLSPPEIPAEEIVGTITWEELKELAKRFFPKSDRHILRSTKGPFPLVSLETLKKFLAADCPLHWHESSYNFCDELAFRLKDHWIRAGLPGHSLSLVKGEAVTKHGKQLCWRNIFITKEDGEFVIYEVTAYTDEVIRIEESNLKPYFVLIRDVM